MIRTRLVCAGALLPMVTAPVTGGAADGDRSGRTPEVVVTATRQPTTSLGLAGNAARLGGDRIDLLDVAHVHELTTQVPGTWIVRGTGQEHLTAIRSPVLTGPGSCGSFLLLEEGIPIRPTGFCNVNGLFESLSEQGRALEVIRGPANALYGSNGVHGTVNVLLPEPGADPGLRASATVGPDRYLRGRLTWDGGVSGAGPEPGSALATGLVVDRDDGFRAASGYDQAKAYLKYARPTAAGDLELGFAATLLDQDTAGFITGRNSYRDETARRQNENEGSYRDADSQRAWLRWDPATDGDGDWEVLAFARRSRMDFLQHFLPGQPIEKNGQQSAGATVLRHDAWGGLRVTTGLDMEFADGFLEEFQPSADVGTPPRPAGFHYDYEVQEYMAAAYTQAEWPVARDWTVSGGLRLEWLRYDYDNRMIAGNTRDDGSACTPMPCLFNRPADRHDRFTNLAPNVGLLHRIGPASSAYLTLTRGFRAPQAAELYRLQAGQTAAELDSESIDSLEAGWRWQGPRLRADLAAFAMRKEDYILQDSNRFNVSDGKSRHVGLEFAIDARSGTGLYGALAGTWARQTYRFDRRIGGGETIVSGNDIDTAPHTLGSARVGWEQPRWLGELEWVHQGRYYLTAEEAAKYGGHDLLNARLALDLSPEWSLTLRVNNLLDRLYADRADFAFGEYRYFPGRDRQAFVEVTWRSAGD